EPLGDDHGARGGRAPARSRIPSMTSAPGRTPLVLIAAPIAAGKSAVSRALAATLRSDGPLLALVELDPIAAMAPPTLPAWAGAPGVARRAPDLRLGHHAVARRRPGPGDRRVREQPQRARSRAQKRSRGNASAHRGAHLRRRHRAAQGTG